MFFFESMRARHVQRRIKGDPRDASSKPPRASGAMRISRRFSESKAGNVSLIFGLLAVPFISFAGLSIDFATASREKARIQTALDAAALAAGRTFQVTGSESEAMAAAALYFTRQTGYTLTVNDIDGDTFVLSVGSEETVGTSFMGVLGDQFDTLTVNAVAKAQLQQHYYEDNGDGETVEVSMMLDITGSMGGQRILDLKSAASDLVNMLVLDGQDGVRIAMAPFSHAVNVGSHFNAMTNKNPVDGNTCVVERKGNKKYKDHVPSSANKYFKTLTAGKIETGRTSSYWSCPDAEIVPLTSNKQLLLDQIDELPTHGNTAGHLGTAWAWYLISKRWSNMFPPERAPSNTLDGVKKIAILMSDGQYNTKWYNNKNSDTQAKKICEKMNLAANGIEVYAVGFELSEGSAAYNRLKDCASKPENFFSAFDGDELKQAFRAIAFKISELRLVE